MIKSLAFLTPKLKRIARKRYNHIKRYIENNEHIIDDKTKEKVTKV